MGIGRTKLLEAAVMVTAEILKQSFAPLLVETTIKYKVPLYLGDHAHVEVWLSELRNTTGILQFLFIIGRETLQQKGLKEVCSLIPSPCNPGRFFQRRGLYSSHFWKKTIHDDKYTRDCE